MNDKEIFENVLSDYDNKLSSQLQKECSFFIQTISKACDRICSKQADKHFPEILHTAIERFSKYSDILINQTKIIEESGMKTEMVQESNILSSILLGSLLEGAIQFFLLFYIDDFRKDKKHAWEKADGTPVDINIVSKKISQALIMLENDGDINSHQRKSLQNYVVSKLKSHEKYDNIISMRLATLINYCKNNSYILSDDGCSSENEESKKHILAENIVIQCDVNGEHFQNLNHSLEKLVYEIANDVVPLPKPQIVEKMKKIQYLRNNIHIFAKPENYSITSTNIMTNIDLFRTILYDFSYRMSSQMDDEENI